MLKKVFILYLLFTSVIVFSQFSINEQMYGSFPAKPYMKFNRYLAVPTFSVLFDKSSSLTASVRNVSAEFEDSPVLYMLVNSNKFKENLAAGLAIYNQKAGVFNSIGLIANYSQSIKFNEQVKLAFGLNLLYSRRGADRYKALTDSEQDPLLQNYQDVSVVNIQPALTLLYNNIYAGVFFENLVDYNLGTSEALTSFANKTIAGHVGYNFDLGKQSAGFMEDAYVRFLAIVKKKPEDLGYGGAVVLDIPRLGWIQGGYDKDDGILAGIGVNITKKISLLFDYQKSDFLNSMELGFAYSFDKIKRTKPKKVRKPINDGNVIADAEKSKPVIKKNDKVVADAPKTKTVIKKDKDVFVDLDSIKKLNDKILELSTLLAEKPKEVRVQTIDSVFVNSKDVVYTNKNIDAQVLDSIKRLNDKIGLLSRLLAAKPQTNGVVDSVIVNKKEVFITNNKVESGALDSIGMLKNRIAELEAMLAKKPKETVRVDTVWVNAAATDEKKDYSIKRRVDTPWRRRYTEIKQEAKKIKTSSTAYYVATDQFKDYSKAKQKLAQYKKRKINAKYIKDPKSKLYYVYINKFAKVDDAERMRKEINGGKKDFENDVKNDLGIKIKSVSKDPVYVVKISYEQEQDGEPTVIRKAKKQAPAKIYTNKVEGVEPGYYIRVSVNSLKSYADKFVDELKADNFNANYYVDPADGNMHVYIFKTDNKQEAIRMYNNNMGGTYYDKKSIIKIE